MPEQLRPQEEEAERWERVEAEIKRRVSLYVEELLRLARESGSLPADKYGQKIDFTAPSEEAAVVNKYAKEIALAEQQALARQSKQAAADAPPKTIAAIEQQPVAPPDRVQEKSPGLGEMLKQKILDALNSLEKSDPEFAAQAKEAFEKALQGCGMHPEDVAKKAMNAIAPLWDFGDDKANITRFEQLNEALWLVLTYNDETYFDQVTYEDLTPEQQEKVKSYFRKKKNELDRLQRSDPFMPKTWIIEPCLDWHQEGTYFKVMRKGLVVNFAPADAKAINL